MKKVALLLSGQIRRLDLCFYNFKKFILDVYNPDIYIEVSKDKYTKEVYKYFSEEESSSFNIREDIKITKTIGTPYDAGMVGNIKQVERVQRYFQQLMGLYMVYKSMQATNINYDFIIRSRFDINLKSALPNFDTLDKSIYSKYFLFFIKV